MQKKYIVRLTGEERCELQEVIRKLKGTSQKGRRAQLLLKADAEGPAWSDSRIAMRLGSLPKGYATWTLRLLARKVVELEIVDSVNYETVRRTLKKTGCRICDEHGGRPRNV